MSDPDEIWPQQPSKLAVLLEQLYDLDRYELRRLAWEALLISDGPDSPFLEEVAEDVTMTVSFAEAHNPGLGHFYISAYDDIE